MSNTVLDTVSVHCAKILYQMLYQNTASAGMPCQRRSHTLIFPPKGKDCKEVWRIVKDCKEL